MIFFSVELYWGLYKWWPCKSCPSPSKFSFCQVKCSTCREQVFMNIKKMQRLFFCLEITCADLKTKKNYRRRIINSVWHKYNMLFAYLCRENLIKNQITFLNFSPRQSFCQLNSRLFWIIYVFVVLGFVFMLLAFTVLLRVALVFVSPQFIDILPC